MARLEQIQTKALQVGADEPYIQRIKDGIAKLQKKANALGTTKPNSALEKDIATMARVYGVSEKEATDMIRNDKTISARTNAYAKELAAVADIRGNVPEAQRKLIAQRHGIEPKTNPLKLSPDVVASITGKKTDKPKPTKEAKAERAMLVEKGKKIGSSGENKIAPKPKKEEWKLGTKPDTGIHGVMKKVPGGASVFKRDLGRVASILGTRGESESRRVDGTKKGPGFLGTLKRPDGKVSTELSIGVKFDGKEIQIPTLIPTLTKDEIKYLLGGGKVTDAIAKKAVDHAKKRIKKGLSPFAGK